MLNAPLFRLGESHREVVEAAEPAYSRRIFPARELRVGE